MRGEAILAFTVVMVGPLVVVSDQAPMATESFGGVFSVCRITQ